ncbi:hypothetical protein ACIOHE_06935 [Streptomyces sp. NPDC087851]|uniref:hypothetical protein n=1 Tax=Streptomyces sp. NPDC087851 TaxID=3365810 RepID=UPI00381D6D7A
MKLADVKPVKLGGNQGRRGLVTVTLTGVQLVEYLRRFDDYEAHGGLSAEEDNGPMARRMYDALAPVVDRIKPGQTPVEAPGRGRRRCGVRRLDAVASTVREGLTASRPVRRRQGDGVRELPPGTRRTGDEGPVR